jgi:hypothetical protein
MNIMVEVSMALLRNSHRAAEVAKYCKINEFSKKVTGGAC